MIILISGGSGSGKSQFAEDYITRYITRQVNLPLYYIATMKLWDSECQARAKKHQKMRSEKNFVTIEWPQQLENLVLDSPGAVLLEDLSNLVANEFFGELGNLDAENAENRVLSGVKNLNQQSEILVVVTNELFSDGVRYDAETTKYLNLLSNLNRQIAGISDEVYEVVAGIPICHKKF